MEKIDLKSINGITIIVLIITIIILLILAGVSIAMLTGDNGVLTKAKNSKTKTEIAEIKEIIELSMQNYRIKNNEEKQSVKEYLIEDLGIELENIIAEYKVANAIAFYYQEYLIIINGNHLKVECMAKEIEKESEKAVLYQDALEEGKYVLGVKANIGWNDRFWINENTYQKNISTVFTFEGVEEFGHAHCFGGCNSLKNVYLSETMKLFGQETFYGCNSLNNIILPSKFESIGNRAFYKCVNLNTINFPETIKKIGESSFRGCSKLDNIIIPPKKIDIGQGVFMECTGLTNVKLLNGISILPGNMFFDCYNIKKIYIPNSIQKIEAGAFNYRGLQKVYYQGNNEEWDKIDIYNNDNNNNTLINATKFYYSEEKPQIEGNYWHYINGNITEW